MGRKKHKPGISKTELLRLGKEFVRKHPDTYFTGAEFKSATGVSPQSVCNHFGGLDRFRDAIGAPKYRATVGSYTPDEVLRKERAKAEAQELRRLAQRAAIEDRLLRDLRDSRKDLPPLPKIAQPRFKRPRHVGSEDGLLLLSDLHIGEVVSEAETGGLGSYDMRTFQARLEYLASKIHKLVRRHQPHLRKLNIACLGDMISGMIHEELSETNEGNSVDMALAGAHLLSQFLLDMLHTFEQIDTWWITGNHGRTGRRPRFKGRYLNWDYVLAQHVRALLHGEKRIRFSIPRSFWTIATVRGKRLLLIHGDQIKSWQGIPFYGMQRAVGELQTLLRDRGGFDAIILGHFHNVGLLDRSTVELIVNGSMKGADEFSIGALFQGGDPKQLFMGVHPTIGISFRYPLNLKSAPTSTRYQWDREFPEASLEHIAGRMA